MNVPITQSADWGKLQDDLGETSFLQTGKNYQFLAIRKSTPVGAYLYCPYGPVYEDSAGLQRALGALRALAREQRAIFVRIEPQDSSFAIHKPKNTRKTKDLSPQDTWLLDLTPSQADLISHFSQGTRTRYNTYAKKGLVVETTQDPNEIRHLVALQRQLFQRKHLSAYGASYLKAELAQPFATLYLVKYQASQDTSTSDAPRPQDQQVLAASLFFDYQSTRYYMQSAADGNFKRLPATVALLTSAIFDAKAKHLQTFDFWGIAPDGAPASHPWAGFTEFKKSFGGYAKHYAGTYDLVIKPAQYRLYQSTRQLNRLIRR